MAKLDVVRNTNLGTVKPLSHAQRCVAEAVYDRRGEQFGPFSVEVSEINLWLDRLTLYAQGTRIMDMRETASGGWSIQWYQTGTEEDFLNLYLLMVTS